MPTFRGILLTKTDEVFSASVNALDHASLPVEGDVEVAIEYSTINYKDALALTNTAPVVRRWPMVPGIDGAGTVVLSSHPAWKTGDRFILNGFGVGETHWGCLAETAKLKGDWLVPLPAGLTAKQSMAIGTAGYTAMLCLMALEKHGVSPASGEILVTGASGGVGSIAISLLSSLGFNVVASTGKLSEASYLKALGANDVIDRATLGAPGKPLQKERWAGVVDSVGSFTLANACAQTRYGGVVAACGLAQGMDFPASVAPFILRGITLAGVDSVMATLALRETAWRRLATEIDGAKLQAISREISLDQTFAAAAEIMAGTLRGRVVVKL
ncbi:MAG: oxidoreductase [Rhodocyclaceae bacterium]|nr:oxidoreductase [Rhodocyclaceae bacterium]